MTSAGGIESGFFQKGIQNIEAVWNGELRKIPITAQIHELAMEESNTSGPEFYSTPEKLVPGLLRTLQKYGIDIPAVDYDVYNIEAEGLGQRLIYPESTLPEIDRSQPLIQSRDDLKKIRKPDFNRACRFPCALEMHLMFKELTAIDPEINFCAPFTLAANIRGIEQLLLDILLNPSLVRELFDRLLVEVLAPWISHLRKNLPGSTNALGSDALASLPIVTPSIIRDWVIPTFERLQELCGPGLYIPNWVGEHCLKDRSPEEMLDLKQMVRPGFIAGQDPDVEILGPEFYREYAEKNGLFLILGIGSAFLDQAGPEEVRTRVGYYTDVGSRNKRFTLLLCNLSRVTPPENIRAAVETARQATL